MWDAKIRIGICDSNVGWHGKMENILKNSECMKDILYEIEHFYGEKELLNFPGKDLNLLFTDIKLKDGNGIILAGKINVVWPECQIVYVTDNLEYAVDVYQTTHLYYVLKRQMEQQLENILKKVVYSLNKPKKKILLSVIKSKKVLLNLEEILYFERRKRVTLVVALSGTYKIWDRLDKLQEILCSDEFIRCHISYLVHLSSVRAVESNSFLMSDQSWVPISRGYSEQVRLAFRIWLDRYVVS